jgi:signal transduction histidine kinase
MKGKSRMLRRLPPYVAALGLVCAATVLVGWLHAGLERPFTSLFVMAVLVTAWIGGLGPGLFASVLSAMAINYFFQEPEHELAVATLGDALQLAIFTAVAVLTSALVRSRERVRAEAAELIQLKSDFVNMVSHELRTPLASMRVSLELLMDEDQGALTARQRRFLTPVRRSMERLELLVGELLDLARAEVGRLDLTVQPVPPRRVIGRAAHVVAYQLKAKKQRLSIDCDTQVPRVLADEKRLEQVLINLLTNASKYTPEGGAVNVVVKPCASVPGQVELAVSDTGPGLSPEEVQRAFDKFFRGDHAKREVGTGLGLAIARSLVELQHGKLTVRSEPGQGATFAIHLPACAKEVAVHARAAG